MNCEQFQENLYDYLDDSLSPPEKAAAQSHLAECPGCREAVEREKKLVLSLGRKFEQRVELVSLDAHTKRSIAKALAQSSGEPRQQRQFPFWLRLALGPGAAAVILIAVLWGMSRFHNQPASDPDTLSLLPREGDSAVQVHISYAVPTYIFQREGNTVVDALVSKPEAADGELLARN